MLIVVVVLISVTLSVVMSFSSLRSSSSLFSFLNSLLSFVNFSLSDLRVSLISPHSVRSELFFSSVHPGLIRDVLNASTLIVVTDFESVVVLDLVDSSNLSKESLLFLELIQSPSGADLQNVSSLTLATLDSIDQRASLVSIESSNATSGKLFSSESEVGVSLRSEVFSLGSLLSGFVVEGVVMGGEHLPEDDIIGVGKVVIEGVTASKTEGHTILTGDLGESEGVDRGDGTTEVVEVGTDETSSKVEVRVSGLGYVLNEELTRLVGLAVCHI